MRAHLPPLDFIRYAARIKAQPDKRLNRKPANECTTPPLLERAPAVERESGRRFHLHMRNYRSYSEMARYDQHPVEAFTIVLIIKNYTVTGFWITKSRSDLKIC